MRIGLIGQHANPNNYINNIVMVRAMRRNNIKKYGIVSKYKRVVGRCLVVVALLPLCSLWLLPIGFYLLGLPLKLLLKSKIMYIRDGLRLW